MIKGKTDRDKDEDDNGNDNEDDAMKTIETRAAGSTTKTTAANLPSCGHYCKRSWMVLKLRISYVIFTQIFFYKI